MKLTNQRARKFVEGAQICLCTPLEGSSAAMHSSMLSSLSFVSSRFIVISCFAVLLLRCMCDCCQRIFYFLSICLSRFLMMNTVAHIKLNYSRLSVEDKVKIRDVGRPLPSLPGLRQTLKIKDRPESYRKFNSEYYKKVDWLCGCEVSNKLFCFICLLCCNNRNESWVKDGIGDLAHLAKKIEKHEVSISHKNAAVDLRILGRRNIMQVLDSAYRLSLMQKNETVKKNRYILSRIIECIKFCGIFEVALRGHDEREDSLNPGVFRGLVNFSSELDGVLKRHLQDATVFRGTSKEIQNDILDCMLTVCHLEIKAELEQCQFVSVIADETTDISAKFQMSIVFRYILADGRPVERFWSFVEPTGHDAVSLATCVKKELTNAGIDAKKLICQSYDGANVMRGQEGGVHALIKKEFPLAHYVHCYVHQLSLIMKQAVSQNKLVRIFFADLNEIPAFFSHSSQRVAVLDEIVGRRVPRGSATRWNFHSRTVQVVHEHLDSLIECFEKVEAESIQTSTIAQARGLCLRCEQPDFRFWLEIFYKIMPHVDILYNQLQKRSVDPLKAMSDIREFEIAIKTVRESVDAIAASPNFEMMASRKRFREDALSSKQVAAKEVCDTIILQVRERFQFVGHLTATNLLDMTKFATYNKCFPQDHFDQCCEIFPFFEKEKLKTDLLVLYSRTDFGSKGGAVPLLQFFIENNLCSVFSEVTKLLKLLITMPVTTSESERTFSTLKRIKTVLRNSMAEDRLVALAMLSIEKDLVRSVQDFNEKVIDIFASKKERRADFIYKSVH